MIDTESVPLPDSAKPMAEVPSKPRKPWLSFVLGLLFPGLGHIYGGAPLRGLAAVLVLVAVIVPIASYIKGLLSWSLPAVLASVLLMVGLALLIPLDGAVVTRRRRTEPKARWNRVWLYVVYAILIHLAMPPVARWQAEHARYRMFKVPSQSMMDTLLRGDYILADMRMDDSTPVTRGEILVFEFPPDPSKLHMKRVIGLPGETLELRAGDLYVDGERIEEPYVQSASRLEDVNKNFGPIEVPDGRYFFLGDRRNASSDSRVWGLVEHEGLRGTVFRVYFSMEEEFDVLGDLQAIRIRWSRIGIRPGATEGVGAQDETDQPRP